MKTIYAIIAMACALSASAQEKKKKGYYPEFEPPQKTALNATAKPDGKDDEPSLAKLDALYVKLPPQPWMVDECGRHFIPNGVVTVTEDQMGNLPEYTRESYTRMRGMGMNCQVIRLCLVRQGGWKGTAFNEEFYQRIDRMVFNAKEQGIKTMFKLTMYDLTKEAYGDLTAKVWRDLFVNQDGAQDLYVESWKRLFERYKDEDAVMSYDLLNEPLCESKGQHTPIWEVFPDDFKDQDDFEDHYFAPLYRRTIAELKKISPEKYANVQWWHYIVANHRKIGFPSERPRGKLQGEGTSIIYSPHYYGDRPYDMMLRYLEDAAEMHMPLMVPEYGAPTWQDTDNDIEAQLVYVLNFTKTVELYDRYCIGIVKAWWSSDRDTNAGPKSRTWALFKGNGLTEGAERKYLTDLIARPRPLRIAGVVQGFNYNFATRNFAMAFTSKNGSAPSEIYLPVNRHYIDGCRIMLDDVVMVISPDGKSLSPLANPQHKDLSCFKWDADNQVLLVTAWFEDGKDYLLKAVPGIRD
ncbi:MAG: cellulase family glycosylhydrolase [Kiritimatiellales bacterium]|nr:cellulase family glycosylhydrolase [Kiritimatiellales bacterium]